MKNYQFQQGHIGLYKREVQRERDSRILTLVSQYATLTPELVQIVISAPLRVIQRRLLALVKRKHLIRYETLDYRVCYAAEKISQVDHKLLIATFRVYLDKSVKVENIRTDAEARVSEGPTFDYYFELGGMRHFVECDTGSEVHSKIVEKFHTYNRH